MPHGAPPEDCPAEKSGRMVDRGRIPRNLGGGGAGLHHFTDGQTEACGLKERALD